MEETVVRKGYRWEDIKMDFGELRRIDVVCSIGLSNGLL
jgi:hypothetical protein